MQMKIAVDIDDTLNVVERVALGSEYIRRTGLPFKVADPHSNEFVKVFDWTFEDATKFIMEGGGIVAFTDAAARKGAREALAGWRKEGHEVVVLTSRFKGWFNNPERVSRDWLEKRRIPYDELVAEVPSDKKGEYCALHGIGILVDDSLAACRNAQACGVRAVLAIGRHNAARAGEIWYGGANWTQINAAVRHIIAENHQRSAERT